MSRERCICSLGEESESRAEGGPASRSFAPVFPLPSSPANFLSCTSSGPADETTPGSGSLTWAEFKREERRDLPAELRVHRFFSVRKKGVCERRVLSSEDTDEATAAPSDVFPALVSMETSLRPGSRTA